MVVSDNTPICVDVINAVAEVEGTAPSDLDFELHTHVHTDALELLSGNGRGPWELSFEVPGHEVTVRADRTVAVDGQIVHRPS